VTLGIGEVHIWDVRALHREDPKNLATGGTISIVAARG
jgi:hypothetical protein